MAVSRAISSATRRRRHYLAQGNTFVAVDLKTGRRCSRWPPSDAAPRRRRRRRRLATSFTLPSIQ